MKERVRDTGGGGVLACRRRLRPWYRVALPCFAILACQGCMPFPSPRRYFSMIENMRSVTQVPHTRAWLCLDQALFDAHFRINMTSQLARHERERTCHNLVPHRDSSPILSINAPFIFKLSIERNMLMEKSHKRCCCCSPLSCQYS